ncbi:putative odorant receptor 83c isoform X2 [Ooceraea biroi]|uniref:putative odorant receptor 83c isoform X2 n=1 Tax=Ooceraea biroi TaxID=2015173 RepID=UPI000F08039A|nr:putative odorant receptor 83c isoform X2 [Ooceraea biroi]
MIGLWPKPEKIRRDELKRNLYVFVVLLMLVIVGLFPCTLSLLRIQQNFTLIIEQLQFILPLVTCVIRLVIFWWKKEDIIPLISMITEDWLKSRNVRERNVMITWTQRLRMIVLASYILTGVAFVSVILLPMFGVSLTYGVNINNTEKRFPLRVYYFFDVTSRPQYELTYISLSIGLFFAAVTYTGIDNFLGLLVFHTCSQLDILSTRFMYLNKFVKFHNGLKNCVMNHTRLLRGIAIIEDTYNKMLLALFLYFSILFAFYGFLIINLVEERNSVSITHVTSLICVVFVIFVHMGLYCAVGEILVIQCDRMYYAICSQEWYTLESKKARNLIFLLIQTKIPCYITVGKIFPMTMATFCSLIKTSTGYVSVLFTTRNN